MASRKTHPVALSMFILKLYIPVTPEESEEPFLVRHVPSNWMSVKFKLLLKVMDTVNGATASGKYKLPVQVPTSELVVSSVMPTASLH